MTVLLAAVAAVLFSAGTYLLLQRQLTRTVIGLSLLAHGANLLLLLSAGQRGQAPFVGEPGDGALLDPLPQAFILTAIVITFGVTAFLLALAYRSYQLTQDDEVQDDLEDRAIAARGVAPVPDLGHGVRERRIGAPDADGPRRETP